MFPRGCLTVSQQENQQDDFSVYAPQHVPPFHVQAAFPEPFAHRMPTPDQPAVEENLRQLALRFLRRPDSQVDMVSIEAGVTPLCRVVIVLELADVL